MSPVMGILVKILSRKNTRAKQQQLGIVCMFTNWKDNLSFMWWKRDEGWNEPNQTKLNTEYRNDDENKKHKKPTTDEQIWNLYIYFIKLLVL